MSARPLLLALLVGGTLLACSSGSSDPFDKSCRGKAVPDCRPFEYSFATAASFEPPMLRPGAVLSEATVHVEYERCAEADFVHRVEVTPRLREDGEDAGAGRTLPGFTLLDDGEGMDAAANDGVIDKVVRNPFNTGSHPPDTDLVLRFEPQAPQVCIMGLCTRCRGEAVEIDYRTGPAFTP